MKGKIAILGAGHVGSHVASALAAGQICEEVVLIGRTEDRPRGQAADISDALSFPPNPVIVRPGVYEDCADADITIVAIGKTRVQGQTRLDMLDDSVRMVHEMTEKLNHTGVSDLVISITNPCDIIADCIRKALKMDRFHCFGTGTLLDTARLIKILSQQTASPRNSIEAFVLGEHGDSSMIPYSWLKIGGRPAAEVAGFDAEEALRRTHTSGMDIIKGKGWPEFGIGQCMAYLAKAILEDHKVTLPLSVLLEGEYGIEGTHCGVPCTVGRNGIEEICELPLTDEEMQKLRESADTIRRHCQRADKVFASCVSKE